MVLHRDPPLLGSSPVLQAPPSCWMAQQQAACSGGTQSGAPPSHGSVCPFFISFSIFLSPFLDVPIHDHIVVISLIAYWWFCVKSFCTYTVFPGWLVNSTRFCSTSSSCHLLVVQRSFYYIICPVPQLGPPLLSPDWLTGCEWQQWEPQQPIRSANPRKAKVLVHITGSRGGLR